LQRIAIVDYDVHHGNGTQDAFWNDPDTLFISLHQDSNYPHNTGAISERGGPAALGSTINLPLPPGTGGGGYAYAFERVVMPALYAFKPDLILVSSGFDASYVDPLARMMLSSEDFASFTTQMCQAAKDMCGGKIVFCHEGGYSKDYVPFCGLAVVQALSGLPSTLSDPYIGEIKQWKYHELQAHQAAVVDTVAALNGFAPPSSSASAAPVDAKEYGSVTAVSKANIYFGGKVVSHTIILPDGSKKTLGLIYPGSYHFGTERAEVMAISDGTCKVVLDGTAETIVYAAESNFLVGANSGFTIEVEEGGICQYVCSYV